MNKNEIITIEEPVQHYPDTEAEHFKCKMLASDNKHYYADLHKTEVALHKFLWSVKYQLGEDKVSKLMDLIDDYGQRKYEEGGINETME